MRLSVFIRDDWQCSCKQVLLTNMIIMYLTVLTSMVTLIRWQTWARRPWNCLGMLNPGIHQAGGYPAGSGNAPLGISVNPTSVGMEVCKIWIITNNQAPRVSEEKHDRWLVRQYSSSTSVCEYMNKINRKIDKQKQHNSAYYWERSNLVAVISSE